MNRKKIKISLEDGDGGKYDLALEGNISKSKIIQFIEVLDQLDVKSKDRLNEVKSSNEKENLTSIGSKIWYLIEQKFPHSTFTTSDILEIFEDEYQEPISLSQKFPHSTFTTSDILEIFEDEYQEPISLSVISTYLFRYSSRNKLSRNKKGREWVYKVIRKPSILEKQSQTFSPLHPLTNETLPTDMN